MKPTRPNSTLASLAALASQFIEEWYEHELKFSRFSPMWTKEMLRSIEKYNLKFIEFALREFLKVVEDGDSRHRENVPKATPKLMSFYPNQEADSRGKKSIFEYGDKTKFIAITKEKDGEEGTVVVTSTSIVFLPTKAIEAKDQGNVEYQKKKMNVIKIDVLTEKTPDDSILNASYALHKEDEEKPMHRIVLVSKKDIQLLEFPSFKELRDKETEVLKKFKKFSEPDPKTLEDLSLRPKDGARGPPDGVDPSKTELYLSDDEFEATFRMDKLKFLTELLPEEQKKRKKEKHIFYDPIAWNIDRKGREKVPDSVVELSSDAERIVFAGRMKDSAGVRLCPTPC